MIIEEGTVITLDDNNRYFLVHEIGELDGYPNKTYYFSAGVTPDEKINTNDICYIEIEKDGNDIFATKVVKNTELHDLLITIHSITSAAEENPAIKDKITEAIENL